MRSSARRLTILLALVAALAAAVAASLFISVQREPRPEGPRTYRVATLAGWPGTDASWRDGVPEVARFTDPFAVTADAAGHVYVADAGDANAIREIDPAGHVTTLAGGAGEGHADGQGSTAIFHTPSGLAPGPAGTLYVSDTGTHLVRRIAPGGIVTTIAGLGVPGFVDGEGPDAAFDGPMGIAVAGDGTVYVADAYNNRIRAIDADRRVRTVAGSGLAGLLDGPAQFARFDAPCGVAVMRDGTLIVADTANDALRRVAADGSVTTLTLVPGLDGTADDVSLFRPVGVAVAAADRVFVTDRRGRLLEADRAGRARLVAGASPAFADGPARGPVFDDPTGVVVLPDGRIVVADRGNHAIRVVEDERRASVLRPRPQPVAPSFDLAAPGMVTLPWPVDPQFAWHEVAGTLGEARGSMSDARERFHAGIDVQAVEGTPVLAVRGAKVDQPLAALGFGSLSESVTVGGFTYIHLRVGRDRRNRVVGFDGTPAGPEGPLPAGAASGRHVPSFQLLGDESGAPVVVRLRRGTRLAIGDALGTVNRFAHVHLNAGRPGHEMNALRLPLAGFVDTTAPVIEGRGVTFVDDTGRPFDKRTGGRTVVRGRVQIVVEAWDRVDGDARRRRLGVYRLGYQVLHADGSPAPAFEERRTTIEFDGLPQQSGAPQLAYAEGSGIPVYGTRRTRFRYIVTNRVNAREAVADSWDTTGLAPGPYVVRVFAADASGNEAHRDTRVLVAP